MLNASSTNSSTSTSFLSNVTVNVVSSSVVHPSSSPNVIVIDFPAKSPATASAFPANATNNDSNSPNFANRFSAVTSTLDSVPGIANVTVFTPYSSNRFSAAVAIPVPDNASIEFIVLSNTVTFIVLLAPFSTSNFSFDAVVSIVLNASSTNSSTSILLNASPS